MIAIYILGKASAPAPKADAINTKILPLKEPIEKSIN
jgi:hypothetical protein